MMRLSSHVDTAISKALTSRHIEPRVRVFVEGKLDYSTTVKVLNEWSHDSLTSHDQLRRIAGPAAVLAINDIAAWHGGLGEELSKTTGLLPADISDSASLVDTYAFVSSGPGWTPFGAHVDFEHSVIIDLIGAGRTIRTWPVGADYGAPICAAQAIAGTSFSWKNHLESSSTVRLDPGDIGVIKAEEPHIFYAHGAGMFLGLSTHGTESATPTTIADITHGRGRLPLKDPDLRPSTDQKHDVETPRPSECCELTVDSAHQTLQMHGVRVTLSSSEFNFLVPHADEEIFTVTPRELIQLSDQIPTGISYKLASLGAIFLS